MPRLSQAWGVSILVLMRKICLSTLLLLLVLPASAQVFLSGNASFNLSGFSRSIGFDDTKPKGIAYSVQPRVGYHFSPIFQAGVTLGFSNQKYTFTKGLFDPLYKQWRTTLVTDRTLMAFGGGLFARLRCISFGNLVASLELSAAYRHGLGSTDKTEYTISTDEPFLIKTPYTLDEIAVRLVPVLSYSLDDHITLDAYIDLLSLAYTYTSQRQYKMYEVNDYGPNPEPTTDYVSAASDLLLGIQSASSQLLSLGFSYTF